MEIQEPLLKMLIFQARFEPSPRFADLRGALVERLRMEAGVPHWSWGDIVEVANESRSIIAAASSRDLRVRTEFSVDAEEFKVLVSKCARATFETLKVESVAFVGVRCYWVAAVESFEDLRDRLVERLGGNNAGIDLVGQPVSDAGWVYEFFDQNPKHMLRFGPMKREQAIGLNLFSEANKDLIPVEFLFVDVDSVFSDVAMATEAAVAKMEEHCELGTRIGAEVTARLALLAQ
jgi:hypothetical protein